MPKVLLWFSELLPVYYLFQRREKGREGKGREAGEGEGRAGEGREGQGGAPTGLLSM